MVVFDATTAMVWEYSDVFGFKYIATINNDAKLRLRAHPELFRQMPSDEALKHINIIGDTMVNIFNTNDYVIDLDETSTCCNAAVDVEESVLVQKYDDGLFKDCYVLTHI